MIVPMTACSPRMELNAHAWAWESSYTQEEHHNELIFANENHDVMFHPSYSSGTAVVRGDTPFIDGNDYYWEIQVLSSLYGTDVMIGVGTGRVSLTDNRHIFLSLLGLDQESWGYSYNGTLQHNSKWQSYGPRFNKSSTIGMHLDMWNGTLSYFVDGKPFGVAFPSLKGRVLYPMVCSTAANSAIRLIYSYSCTSSLQQLCLRSLNNSIHMMKLVSTIPGLRGLVDKTFLTYQSSSETEIPSPLKNQDEANMHNSSIVVVDSDDECIGERKKLRKRKRKFSINLHRTGSATTSSEFSSHLDDLHLERGCTQCGAIIRPRAELRDNEIILLPSSRIPESRILCLFCDVIL